MRHRPLVQWGEKAVLSAEHFTDTHSSGLESNLIKHDSSVNSSVCVQKGESELQVCKERKSTRQWWEKEKRIRLYLPPPWWTTGLGWLTWWPDVRQRAFWVSDNHPTPHWAASPDQIVGWVSDLVWVLIQFCEHEHVYFYRYYIMSWTHLNGSFTHDLSQLGNVIILLYGGSEVAVVLWFRGLRLTAKSTLEIQRNQYIY